MSWKALAALSLISAAGSARAGDIEMMRMRYMDLQVSPEGLDLPNDPKTLGMIADDAKCLASRWRYQMLAALPGTSGDKSAQFDMLLMPGECNKGDNLGQFTPMVARGAYAEYSLTQDFDLASGTPHGRPQKIFQWPDELKLKRLTFAQRSALSFVEYGSCVAKVDYPGVSRLIQTGVGTSNEIGAFSALSPALSQCLAPGITLKLNKLKLRGYLAEGAYRDRKEAAEKLATNPAPAPGKGVK